MKNIPKIKSIRVVIPGENVESIYVGEKNVTEILDKSFETEQNICTRYEVYVKDKLKYAFEYLPCQVTHFD